MLIQSFIITLVFIACVVISSDTKYKCMNIYRRTDDVLEIQEGPSTAVRGRAACAQDLMIDTKLPFITLLSMI